MNGSWIALVLLLAVAPAAAEEVYKWVDKDGVVHYTDKPPSQNAKPAALPPLQTYPGNKLPDVGKLASPAPAAPPAKLDVQIMTPAPDETIRGAEAMVSIAVVVSPGLSGGQRLVYRVDGQPLGAPTAATSQSVRLERGSHSLTVAVVDESGQELARSPSVTVHMKPRER